jgi:hypothetical protein
MEITAKKYFEAFEKKDINAIRELFDPDVKLRDWEISVSGIDSVLAATNEIFCSAESISIKLICIIQSPAFVVVELDISIDNINPIHVVDLIEFSSTGKICAIRAFRG